MEQDTIYRQEMMTSSSFGTHRAAAGASREERICRGAALLCTLPCRSVHELACVRALLDLASQPK